MLYLFINKIKCIPLVIKRTNIDTPIKMTCNIVSFVFNITIRQYINKGNIETPIKDTISYVKLVY